MASLTRAQQNAMYKSAATQDIVASLEGLQQSLGGLVDFKTNPEKIFDRELFPLVENYVVEGLREQISANMNPDDGEMVFMESLTESEEEVSTPMETVDAHMHNISQLLENSLIEGKTGSANLRNLNELTPLDAFIPLMIARSYLPLCGKDLIPYIVPKMNFVRIKELQKWINTKNGNKYRRPDVYNDTDAVMDIINSGKGRRVTADWFPKGEETSESTGDVYEDSEKVKRKIPETG